MSCSSIIWLSTQRIFVFLSWQSMMLPVPLPQVTLPHLPFLHFDHLPLLHTFPLLFLIRSHKHDFLSSLLPPVSLNSTDMTIQLPAVNLNAALPWSLHQRGPLNVCSVQGATAAPPHLPFYHPSLIPKCAKQDTYVEIQPRQQALHSFLPRNCNLTSLWRKHKLHITFISSSHIEDQYHFTQNSCSMYFPSMYEGVTFINTTNCTLYSEMSEPWKNMELLAF